MDYLKIYNDFIGDRKSKLPITGYTERHHIKPKSLGGDNKNSNIIKLTPGDHYFAHELLAKIHNGKMFQSLYFMSHENTTSAKNHTITRHQYDYARRMYNLNLPECVKNIGSRLANNENRLAGLKLYHETVNVGESISNRYKDPLYFEKWMLSQKDVWTKEKRAIRSELSKELWKNKDYVEKMKARKCRDGRLISNDLKRLWADPCYIEKMKKRKKSPTMFTSEQVSGFNKDPVIRAKMDLARRERWKSKAYKENHRRKLRSNSRTAGITHWYHKDYGVVYAWHGDFEKLYGVSSKMVYLVKSGKRKSSHGWRLATCDDALIISKLPV